MRAILSTTALLAFVLQAQQPLWTVRYDNPANQTGYGDVGLGLSLRHDSLLVGRGMLRYLECRDPGKPRLPDVGHKAVHCLLCSTRWQTFFVRPGMEQALLDLCKVDVTIFA